MPSWFLEALFKRKLSITQQCGRDMVETPFQFVKKSLVGLLSLLCVFSLMVRHSRLQGSGPRR